ncbi:MAG: helix-hairpin-helix domain-containing protein [Acidobacteriota bacterium]
MTPGRLAWIVAGTAMAFGACVAGTARAADPDPNLPAVQTVCGRCHSTEVFLNKPRSWDRWNDVFADMTQRGANGTDEELVRVTAYFLENLTLVNVNTSPADEIAGVLGVGNDVADAIIARRTVQRFVDIAELRALPGVNSGRLESRKSRILF